MIKCEICNNEFINNLGGQLTIHLKKEHNLSMEDYIIITEYDNIEPKCICGLCNERPVFFRGKFRKYAKGHDSFKEQEKKYLEINGNPICQNSGCENRVKFFRGKPQKYCSLKCSGKNTGFSLSKTQEIIKNNVKEKYDVDNISKLESVKEKLSKSIGDNWLLNKKEILKKYHNTILEKGDNYYFKKITKKYKNTNLYYQSKLEFNFLEYCENVGILNKIKNGKRIKLIDEEFGYYYLPDFIFDDRYVVALKSTWMKKIQGGDVVLENKNLS